VGVACSVSSPSFWCPSCPPTGRCHSSFAGLRVQFDEDAGLAAVDHHRPPVRGAEHRRVLQVPVVQVVRGELVVPQQLSGRAQLHHRVGVQVRAGPAAPQRVALGAEDRAGIADAEVDVALGVEGWRVPQPAAGVDARIAPQVLHRAPGPLRRAGRGVQRPQDPLAAGQVLTRHVGRDGGHVHGAVVEAGGHGDAFVVVADQRPAPQLRPGCGVQGDRGLGGGRVHDPADDVDAVRSAVGRVVLVRPQDLSGGQANRVHVGFQVLDVHHPVHDHRRGRVSPVGAGRRDRQRHRPRHPERRDVRAGDSAGHVPGVGQVRARQGPARRRLARCGRGVPGQRRAVLGRARHRARTAAATATRAAARNQAGRDHQRRARHRGPASADLTGCIAHDSLLPVFRSLNSSAIRVARRVWLR